MWYNKTIKEISIQRKEDKMKYILRYIETTPTTTRLEMNGITLFKFLTKELKGVHKEPFELEETNLSENEKRVYKLIYYRKRLNMTMQEVANLFNKSKQAIYHMENFRRKIKEEELEILRRMI